MGPNLRSLVTKAYRVRQGRTFSSSAPNPINDKGKGCGIIPTRSVIDSVWDTMNRLAPWFVVGSAVKFGLDISALLKSSQKSDDLHQAYMREFDLNHQAYMRELERNHEEKMAEIEQLSVAEIEQLSVAEIEQLAPVTGFSEE